MQVASHKKDKNKNASTKEMFKFAKKSYVASLTHKSAERKDKDESWIIHGIYHQTNIKPKYNGDACAPQH